MESDIRYYSRRARAEMLAASRALTVEAKTRRLNLAECFARKADELRA